MKAPLDFAMLGLTAMGFGAAIFVGAEIVARTEARAAGARTLAFSGGGYCAPTAPRPPPGPQQWRRPSDSRRSGGWRYDLFTPPLVRLDAAGGASVAAFPRLEPATDRGPARQRPLELVSVQPRPYRFRLAGFAGSVDRPVFTLEEIATGATVLLRAGQVDERHALEVRRCELRRAGAASGGSARSAEAVATLVVYDRREGREVMLSNAQAVATGESVGLFRRGEEPVQAAAQGDVLRFEGMTYTVVLLSHDPPRAELTEGDAAGLRIVLAAGAGVSPTGGDTGAVRNVFPPPNAVDSSDEPRAPPVPSLRAGPAGGDP